MKRKLLLIAMLLGLQYVALAQTRNVSGKVVDAGTKTPIRGVSILVPGTKIGTTTNDNGEFNFSVPQETKNVRVTFIGYQEQLVELTGKLLQIALTDASQNLRDVVVVGYGTQKKKDLTGAISTISSEDIVGRATVQVSEALQGAIPGVSVTRSSAAPGAGATVQIRGVTSLNTNSPLVVVDGIPVSSMDLVNPNDIQTLTVLKDAASAAIYGSRGAAGVILITTKRGIEGKSSLEYNFEYALQKPTALPRYADAPTYMRLFNEQAVNDGAATGPYANDYIVNFEANMAANPDKFPFANTNWQDLIMSHQYAPRQQHDLVFTAGSKSIKTKASLGYQKVGAFYDNFSYERYQFRVNNDIEITSKLSANIDLGLRRVNALSPVDNPFSGQTPIYEARLMPPVYAATYTNGAYAIAKDGRNPLAQLQQGGTKTANSNQLQGRLALNYKPIKDLTLTALVAPTFDFDKSKAFSKKITYTNPDGTPSSASNTPLTTLKETRTETYNLNGQFLANYNKTFADKHHFTATAGFESIYFSNENLGASRDGFSLTDFPYLNQGSQLLRDNSGSASEESLHSIFGRLTYDYMNRYYVQVNLRHDQSSRFGKAYRGATFPSFSAGWAISEESFMKDVHWINYLKLRGSYGSVGNQRITNADGSQSYYPYQATIDPSTALFYQNGSLVPLSGGAQVTYAVKNISWETTRSSDIGIDAAFLNNRLSVTGDYFQKKTDDILLPLDIPLIIGFERPQQNAGTLDVKGWEIAVNWKDKINEFSYGIGVNLSDARTKILDMKGTRQEIDGQQVNMEGSQFKEWYGYLSNGIYQTAADAAGTPRTSSAVTAGDIRYVDIDHNGIINANDRVLLGGSLPRYQYGGNVNLGYKGFDCNFSFQGVGKRLSRLNNDIVRPFQEQFGNFPALLEGNFYSKTNTTEQNQSAKYPRLSNTSSGNNYATSDFWLIDGSYFRLKNVTLGYTLKKDVLSKIGISSLRVYLAANDLFTSSKFPKYSDPESGNAAYPIVTTFLAGVNLRF
ncbi:TonB-dependent receptor [Pedobacter sp. HMWF019]|uniref:SusC/RagA family TonB-linked outer membrane protein n=1 Tax=Pedobacter sp. HMWF019 TaxID=2056856 RepID=UPI000D36D3F4|nr:TonB-dependent receptor [Pedobacter sp. HMWF019]PTS96893.1 TonB-dependent receptor [Pedobacter sp. HMWF019]